jgi:hypothetical protein
LGGWIGLSFGIILFGTISATFFTVGANGSGGFTGLGGVVCGGRWS